MKRVFGLLVLFQIFAISIALNFFIKKFEMCDPAANYSIKLYGKFRQDGRDQLLDANASLDIPFSNDLYVNGRADVLIGEKYVNIIALKEARACDKFNKYFGEFWYDLERAAQLIPGSCPIRKGRYHVRNLRVNFNKLTLQAFPFGTIRIGIILSKTQASDVAICVKILLENKAF